MYMGLFLSFFDFVANIRRQNINYALIFCSSKRFSSFLDQGIHFGPSICSGLTHWSNCSEVRPFFSADSFSVRFCLWACLAIAAAFETEKIVSVFLQSRYLFVRYEM